MAATLLPRTPSSFFPSPPHLLSSPLSRIPHSVCSPPNQSQPPNSPLSLSSKLKTQNPYLSSSSSPPSTSTSQFKNSPSIPHPELDPGFSFDKFVQFLRLSGRYGDAELARAAHAAILKFEEDTQLANALIVAYLDLGLLRAAYNVFSGLSAPDVASFTAIVSAFGKGGYEDEAIRVFCRMRESGLEPNGFTLVAALTACSRIMDLKLGLQMHSLSVKSGYLYSTYVGNALMGLYSKCGCPDYVAKVFDGMPERDIASWNTVMSCLLNDLMYDRVFQLFRQMQETDGFRVDRVTILTLLNACVECVASKTGRELHAHSLKAGFESNLTVSNALIGFYSRCGGIQHVQALFERMEVKDILTWTGTISAFMAFGKVELALGTFKQMPVRNCVTYNAVLSGLSQNGEGSLAIRWFCKMIERSVGLTDFSLTSILHACSLVRDKNISEQMHGFIHKFGSSPNSCVRSALIDMLTRCGSMNDAKKVFDRIEPDQDNSLHWTPMICGYARDGQPEEAVSLFHRGQLEEVIVLDDVLTTSMIGISGALGFLELGEQLHCHARRSGFLSDLAVGNALISMYSKCGDMEAAMKVFDLMSMRDEVSWNALIAGHLSHRDGDAALVAWSKMENAPVKPDGITFVLVISSYRHTRSNHADDCRRLFFAMKSSYGVDPSSDHYAAFVSVLGFWGFLEEAEETIAEMPFEPEASVWRALLDGCRINLNTEVGKRAIKRILAVEPHDTSTFILQSNLYAASGMWHLAETKRQEMKLKGFSKNPGRSWVVIENKVHSFYARDEYHPQSKDTNSGLEILILECMKAGYVPDTSFVLHEVEEYQKKDFLFYHSAKLAVTYALLMTKSRKPVRVSKNIRLCGDCHNFLKHVSVVTKRDVCLRDTTGFHYFSGGLCTCGDRW